jgi:hypothetical protein
VQFVMESQGVLTNPLLTRFHCVLQVGAAGAVREAHGHMLGPDEAALIESDDSDKVGYADEQETTAAGAGSKPGRQAGAAAAGGGASKTPKKGLGFKG